MRFTRWRGSALALLITAALGCTLAVVASGNSTAAADSAQTFGRTAATSSALPATISGLAASLGILSAKPPEAALPDSIRFALSGGAKDYGVNAAEARAVPDRSDLYIVPGSSGVCLVSSVMVTCAPTDEFLKGRALSSVAGESAPGVISSVVVQAVVPDGVSEMQVRGASGQVVGRAKAANNFVSVNVADFRSVATVALVKNDGTTLAVLTP